MNLNGCKFHLVNANANDSGNEFNPNRKIRKLVDLFKLNEVVSAREQIIMDSFQCRRFFTFCSPIPSQPSELLAHQCSFFFFSRLIYSLSHNIDAAMKGAKEKF